MGGLFPNPPSISQNALSELKDEALPVLQQECEQIKAEVKERAWLLGFA